MFWCFFLPCAWDISGYDGIFRDMTGKYGSATFKANYFKNIILNFAVSKDKLIFEILTQRTRSEGRVVIQIENS